MLEDWLIRAGVAVRTRLPRRVAQGIALATADACWLTLAGRRRTLEDNLSRIVPETTQAQRRRLARATFRNLARSTADFLAAPALDRTRLARLIHPEGLEHLDRALARGRGAIVVTPHLGNFELAGLCLAALGYPCQTIAESISPERDRLYTRLRETTGLRVAPLVEGALASLRALDRKELVILLGDRVFGPNGIPVRFCGGQRLLPRGPASMALSRGAPLLVGFVVLSRTTGGHPYLGLVEPEVPFDDLSKEDVVRLTERLADRLSAVVRRYPDQWFVFQPGWRPDVA